MAVLSCNSNQVILVCIALNHIKSLKWLHRPHLVSLALTLGLHGARKTSLNIEEETLQRNAEPNFNLYFSLYVMPLVSIYFLNRKRLLDHHNSLKPFIVVPQPNETMVACLGETTRCQCQYVQPCKNLVGLENINRRL